MRIPESSMPDEELWETFFDAEEVIDAFGIPVGSRVLELGSGYGTFTFPLARLASHLRSFEIDDELFSRLSADPRLDRTRVDLVHGDFFDGEEVRNGGPYDVVVAFNILHCDDPVSLLRMLRDSFAVDGFLAIMHWRSDIDTPRGPPLAIRPSREKCIEWCRAAGFGRIDAIRLDTARYHFGLAASTRFA